MQALRLWTSKAGDTYPESEGSAPKPGDWPQERLLLQTFALMRIDVSDAISVIDHLDFPNLVSISTGYAFAAVNHSIGGLNFGLKEDIVNDILRAVCQANRPRFGFIQSLALPCSITHERLFLSTLHNVKSLRLDFALLPDHFDDSLTSHSPLLWPRLERLKVTGLTPKALKTLIQARQRSPCNPN